MFSIFSYRQVGFYVPKQIACDRDESHIVI